MRSDSLPFATLEAARGGTAREYRNALPPRQPVRMLPSIPLAEPDMTPASNDAVNAVNALTAERLRAELGFMYELCQVVASNSELQPILDWIAQKTTGMFQAD